MAKNLLIVESPAKAKTIEKYLGKDYVVKSSYGHIRDLPKKGLNIDIAKGFQPTYAVSSDKKKVVSELKTAAKASEVWLASDEDREGEAIAWHLCHVLGLKPEDTKRIVFHEITKPAIQAAIKQPRTVDINLVNAQQARRVLDRLVGYELSPVLWKKVRPGLSAGRVQSVAVRLIVEREREIKAHQAASNYRVTAVFDAQDRELPAELSVRPDTETSAREFLEACRQASFTVQAVDQKPGSRNPGAPFTTSSLQQEAARRLGFSVKQTMSVAQRLYESGHITYMRTDSPVLSAQAISAAADYITAEFGKPYHHRRQFKATKAGAQEAHEAIRPTDFAKATAGSDQQQKKLYDLIRRRALASQMTPAKLLRTEITIAVSGRPEVFKAKGEVLQFDGFLRVYGGGKDDVILPELNNGDQLDLTSLTATETFTKPPARYSEASLVKKLEELGIGRPSTYAPTISTIQSREYVVKTDLEGRQQPVKVLELREGQITERTDQVTTGADRNKLVPTHTADVTTDFLVKYFGSIVDYDFTAKVEAEFDDIADGKEDWTKMLTDFYQDFHPLIKDAEQVSRQESSQARTLGIDPKSQKPVIARYGRYGPMLQIGEAEDEEKPRFAPLPAGKTLDDVNLDEALEMFKLPRSVGTTEDGEEIRANIGRFGPYIQIGKTYVSIKPLDPLTITEAEARQLYQEKLDKDAAKNIAEFPSGLKILKGPYGAYVTDGKKNARIPKDTDPTSLTEKDAQALLAKAPVRGKRTFKRRGKS